jgi:hypothetical protein
VTTFAKKIEFRVATTFLIYSYIQRQRCSRLERFTK